MTLAFLIYSYFPYGGQQRDFLKVANACIARGHKVVAYTMKWQGEMPADMEVVLVDVKAWSRHALYQRFTTEVTAALQASPVDAVIGFNKMPGLDLYFAADPCFAERAQKQRGFYYRFTPRYRHFMAYEAAVFGTEAKTQVLLLSPLQRGQFEQHYPNSVQRFHDIPPGISLDRQLPKNANAIRASFRHQFRIEDHELAIVQIGSGFVVKGVDRSLRALASLPASMRHNIRYFVVGQDKSERFRRLAKRLGIADRCEFLGGRDDVPRFLLGADLMLHPAYSESAGYTLLEATIVGLPVLTTATCGYAFHIERAGAGLVSPSPFDQQRLNVQLLEMLTSPEREQWRTNGIVYGRTKDLYSMPETVASLIEDLVRENASGASV